MTKTPAETMVDMARLAGEMVQAVVEQEAQVLHLVQAEVDALGNLVLSRSVKADPAASDAEAEAEIEAGFDNMPV